MNVIVLGATSAMIRETNRLQACEGARFLLVGRHREKLAVVSADLCARGAVIAGSVVADLRLLESHTALIEEAWKALGEVDLVLVAHGALVDQRAAEDDPMLAVEGALVNYTSVISLLTLVGQRMEIQGRGVIAVISSVAGDRGRRSNYIYGSAKAGLDAFLSGLRNRLHGEGVAVVTIKPGFVETPMTAALRVTPLFADPRRAGAAILAAIRARRDVVYVPWWWRWIMLVIRLIPEPVFKRMKL
jgi:short-subunit dehydrogenase